MFQVYKHQMVDQHTHTFLPAGVSWLIACTINSCMYKYDQLNDNIQNHCSTVVHQSFSWVPIDSLILCRREGTTQITHTHMLKALNPQQDTHTPAHLTRWWPMKSAHTLIPPRPHPRPLYSPPLPVSPHWWRQSSREGASPPPCTPLTEPSPVSPSLCPRTRGLMVHAMLYTSWDPEMCYECAGLRRGKGAGQ